MMAQQMFADYNRVILLNTSVILIMQNYITFLKIKTVISFYKNKFIICW